MSPRLTKLYTAMVTAAQDAVLREGQLRNFSRVMSGSLPKRKEKRLQPIMAGYQARHSAAQQRFTDSFIKYHKRAEKEGAVS